jgi:hypothetical protein
VCLGIDNFELFGKSPDKVAELIKVTLSWSAFEQVYVWQVLAIENGCSPIFIREFVPKILGLIDPTDHLESMSGVTGMLISTAPCPKLFLYVVGSREGDVNFYAMIEKVLSCWAGVDNILKDTLRVLGEELANAIGREMFEEGGREEIVRVGRLFCANVVRLGCMKEDVGLVEEIVGRYPELAVE